MSRPPLPPRMTTIPPPPHNLPREVRVNANNSNNNNNLGSVASSVSFGHVSEGDVNNGNWENENENNWNGNNASSRTNSANGGNNWVNDGSTAFSVSHESDVLRGKAGKEAFNKISAEVIAAHPEWRLEAVSGNPLAYSNNGPGGYVFWVATIPATEPPALFAIWPQYAAAMEERMPGLGLFTDLRAETGWISAEEAYGPALRFAAQMAQGHGGRRRKVNRRRKTRKSRRAQKKTRKSHRKHK